MAAVIRYEGKRGTVYRAKFWVGRKQVMRTLAATNPRDAREEAERMEREARNVTLAAYAEQWLRDHERSDEWAANTARNYRGKLDNAIEFFGADEPLSVITEQQLRRYIAYLETKWAYATVVVHLAVLRHLWRDAMRVGLVQFDWPHKIDRPQRRDLGRPYRVKPTAPVDTEVPARVDKTSWWHVILDWIRAVFVRRSLTDRDTVRQ